MNWLFQSVFKCVKIEHVNQKIVTILTIVVVLLALVAAGFLSYKNLIKPAMEKAGASPAAGEKNGEASKNGETKPAAGPGETLKETTLVKAEFTITLPPGWQEVPDFPDVLAMAIDTQETITAELEDVDFRTNLSIKSDDLSKYSQVQGIQDYVESIKASLVQLIPGIKFTFEDEDTVDTRRAIFVECESRQEDIDFKTLLVFIEGDDQAVWGLSFNTLQESWPAYRDVFYQMAESFKLESGLKF